MTKESAYREGYRNGANGWGLLPGIDSYRHDPICAAWIEGYGDGIRGRPNKLDTRHCVNNDTLKCDRCGLFAFECVEQPCQDRWRWA